MSFDGKVVLISYVFSDDLFVFFDHFLLFFKNYADFFLFSAVGT